MLEVDGKVVHVEKGFAWIIREGGQTCGHCDPKTGCKSMAISRLFCKKEQAFQVSDPLGVAVGECVSIGLEEKVLLSGALAGYGVPVFALILGAGVGLLLGAEYLSILGGGIGFIVAMLWLRRKKIALDSLPVILRRKDNTKPIRIIS